MCVAVIFHLQIAPGSLRLMPGFIDLSFLINGHVHETNLVGLSAALTTERCPGISSGFLTITMQCKCSLVGCYVLSQT